MKVAFECSAISKVRLLALYLEGAMAVPNRLGNGQSPFFVAVEVAQTVSVYDACPHAPVTRAYVKHGCDALACRHPRY